MIRRMRFLAVVFLAVTAVSACATVAGGLIGTGVGAATGHPVSGALIGTGVGIMIDTAPRHKDCSSEAAECRDTDPMPASKDKGPGDLAPSP
jgi:hypothetical protein